MHHLFQKSLERISNIPVEVSYKEIYEIESANKKKGKDKNRTPSDNVKLSSSSLHINGLCQSYLDEFLIAAGLIRDTEENVKKKHESVQGESTAPLKNSGQASKSVDYFEESNKQQENKKTKHESEQGKSTAPLKNKGEKKKKHESVQGKSTSALKNSKKTSKSVDCFEESNKQQEKDNNLSKHECASNAVLAQRPCFKWLWEAQSDGIFQDIGAISTDIEAAYTNNQKDFQSSSEPLIFVDFTSMTVNKNKNKTGIIRTEILGKLREKL